MSESTAITVVSAQEITAIDRLKAAISALTDAVVLMPITEVVSLKAQMVTIQTATKELNMSKDAQDLAAEAVRRCEWQMARKIREGQAEGTIASQGPAPDFSLGEVSRVTEFGTTGELYARDGKPGILTMADTFPTAESFDAALDQAKAEGNLSRANVARKARENAGAESKPRRRPLTDVARDVGWDARKHAEKVKRLSDDDRFDANAEQVATHLRSHLTYAIEVYQDLLDRINNN